MKRNYLRILGIALLLPLFYSCKTTSVGYQTPTEENITQIEVQVNNDDISYNLDLRAVADVFANSKNLADFEKRINWYGSRINNLDLNDDGRVDYLRVLELKEGYTHVILLQAVLGTNLYQDVASILIERHQNKQLYLQVIGDSYIYGSRYIIEPIFSYEPTILSIFQNRNYTIYSSPYYWRNYPNYYRTYRPYSVENYNRNIEKYLYNRRMSYNYGIDIRSEKYNRMSNSVRRNDYALTNPNRSFSVRNKNRAVNRRGLEKYVRSSSVNYRKRSTSKIMTQSIHTRGRYPRVISPYVKRKTEADRVVRTETRTTTVSKKSVSKKKPKEKETRINEVNTLRKKRVRKENIKDANQDKRKRIRREEVNKRTVRKRTYTNTSRRKRTKQDQLSVRSIHLKDSKSSAKKKSKKRTRRHSKSRTRRL